MTWQRVLAVCSDHTNGWPALCSVLPSQYVEPSVNVVDCTNRNAIINYGYIIS